MKDSEAWEEQHLTPAGWVSGSYRRAPWPAVTVAAPVAGVLTVRRNVISGVNGPARATEDRTPRSQDDAALIDALLAQFGNPKFNV